ncbi:MAG: hypothetical protein JWP87_482 [Labilithrix sp.]|nr:hypothetical protein [Labilithrix sp.]
MKNQWIKVAVVTLGTTLVAGTANAQEKDESASAKAPPALVAATHSLELTVATGYSQGFGTISSGQPTLSDVGQAGGAIQVGVGYRLTPHLTLAVYGAGSMFGRGDQVDQSANLYSAAAGVQADWHFLPADHRFDPWVSLGSGWRGYWVSSNLGTTALHGVELAKLQVGVDYRIDESISISPVIGADLTTFVTQSTPATNSFDNISNPNVNTFVFAGFQGRFDIRTGARPSAVASR